MPSCSLSYRAQPARGVLERQQDEPISRKGLALLLESHPLFLDLLSIVANREEHSLSEGTYHTAVQNLMALRPVADTSMQSS
jgi:hypothetical protein